MYATLLLSDGIKFRFQDVSIGDSSKNPIDGADLPLEERLQAWPEIEQLSGRQLTHGVEQAIREQYQREKGAVVSSNTRV